MENKPQVRVGFGVMILKNNQVLLGKRHDDPIKASSALHGEGTWTMPGGKMHFGQSFEEEVAREALEETGIKINKDKLKFISLTNDIVTDAHFVTAGFLCEEFEGEPKVMEPDEITQWQWFDLDKLPIPIYPPSQKVINHFLSDKIY